MACTAGTAGRLPAQRQVARPGLVPVGRVDLIIGNPAAVQAGLGFTYGVGDEFRLGATAAVGGSSRGLSGRADVFGQFSLDPYGRGSGRWRPYIGGGLTVRLDQVNPGTGGREGGGRDGGGGGHAYLLAFIGAEGPRTGRFSPGVELGLGGGVRLGVTLRRTGK